MKVHTFVFISIVSVCGLANGPLSSASKPSGPIAVSVNPVDVPILLPGNRGSGILTVFVVAKSKLAVKTVCYWMPRIQDSILQMFYADPLTKGLFEQLHLGSQDKRLYRTVREAMRGSKSVVRVHAIGGTRIPLNTVSWAKKIKIQRCKKKDKKDKKESKKAH